MGYSLAVVASAGAARSRAVVALAGASAFLLKPFFYQLTKLLRLIRENIVSPERGRRDFKSPESEPT